MTTGYEKDKQIISTLRRLNVYTQTLMGMSLIPSDKNNTRDITGTFKRRVDISPQNFLLSEYDT